MEKEREQLDSARRWRWLNQAQAAAARQRIHARFGPAAMRVIYCSCGAPVADSEASRSRHAERSPKCKEEMGV